MEYINDENENIHINKNSDWGISLSDDGRLPNTFGTSCSSIFLIVPKIAKAAVEKVGPENLRWPDCF